ncbi:MAG: hypothetical protein JWN04_1181, partial [Myxococcaceae bacterium]|nr:hypothetical protein [Myxococcaceae bacterium]
MSSVFEFRPRDDQPRDLMPVRGGHDTMPGENCLAERGRYFPVIDRNRCE